MSANVFISYASDDKDVADQVVATLESNKNKCWIAPRDVPAGDSYAKSIVRAIRDARVFVLIFSSSTNQSEHVEREVERAGSSKLPIIPFRIEDIKPTDSLEYFLSSPQWIDAFVPPVEQYLESLVDAVQRKLQEPATQDSLADNKGGRARSRSVIARLAFGKIGCLFSITFALVAMLTVVQYRPQPRSMPDGFFLPGDRWIPNGLPDHRPPATLPLDHFPPPDSYADPVGEDDEEPETKKKDYNEFDFELPSVDIEMAQ